jgi:hypothetical protein
MILDLESWMDIRRFRVLHGACATDPTIADRLAAAVDHPVCPVGGGLAADDIDLKGTVIYERLVAEHGSLGFHILAHLVHPRMMVLADHVVILSQRGGLRELPR